MSKNVFVYAEQRDGKLQKVAFELVGKGKELAAVLGQKTVAVLFGYQVTAIADQLIAAGADEVIVVDNEMLKLYVTEPYTKAFHQVIKENDPEIFLIGATSIGRDLAPRVSARIHTGLTADCTSLDIDSETKNLRMTRPAFGGNIMATIVCENYRPQMATVRPGVMKALEKDPSRKGEIKVLDVAFDAKDMNIKVREEVKAEKQRTDITEAKILVSGGRGLGSPENYDALIRPLAKIMGGDASSSRSVVDAGWVDKDRQVGQTGKTVRPDLYLACGISGAIQHVAGMEGSEYIIAINKNNTAPIFDVADLGIVGDVNVILPKLTEAIKNLKQKGE